jgi:hypothetical protein
MLVRLLSDSRPPEERGTRKFLGTSYVGGNTLIEPTDVSLIRILARDLVASGVSTGASWTDAGEPYTLDVAIKHLGAAFSEGPQTLTVVLPVSPVHARCAFGLRLRDRDGRLFLDEVFSSEVRRSGALLTGLEREAVKALSEAIRAAVDQALPRLRQSIDAYWQRIR